MKFNFTIIVPSRDRYDGLTDLLKSISALAKYPDKIEIILRLDIDDRVGRKAARDMEKSEKVKCKIVKVIKPRSEFLSDLWDECYELASADIIMACADDCIFRTKHWDTAVMAGMPNPKTTVYFCYGNDTIQKNFLATFPILSRAWVECAGFFMPRGYKRDWCDTHLHDIALRLKREHGIAQRRVIKYFKDVIFEHRHPAHKKGVKYDATYAYRLKMACEEKQYRKRSGERSKIARRIATYILKGKPPKGAKL